MPGHARHEIRRLCVFCGSSLGTRSEYAEAARELARLLASEQITLVYGGAHVGLMGVLADAALAAGGEVVGVIPAALVEIELAHRGLTELHVVASMSARKARMAELADAFVALPGGFGTLEELFEVLTSAQVGLHDKPVGLLEVDGYFDGLTSFLRRAVDDRLLKEVNRRLLIVEDSAPVLLERLRTTTHVHEPKWIDPAPD